jgi:hypothetical protein
MKPEAITPLKSWRRPIVPPRHLKGLPTFVLKSPVASKELHSRLFTTVGQKSHNDRISRLFNLEQCRELVLL